jgi:polysaccharide chain length determinant protein (PEP-CTERM system associated)
VAQSTGIFTAADEDALHRARTLEGFRDRIKIEVRSAGDGQGPDVGGSIYTITYRDGQRPRGLKVVDTLLTALVEDTLGGKRKGSADAQQFLANQLREYEERLRTAEDQLAAFKKKNIGLMPTEQGGYFTSLQAEIDALAKARSDLSVAQSRRSELARQLRGEAVIGATSSPVPTLPGASAGGDTTSRIQETQSRLDDLLLRFTDKHPEVIATRETLEELKRRRESEVEALRRGDPNAAALSGASRNPVYQSIQLQLNQTDVEIASLRGHINMHERKISDLRRMLDTMPQVEAEYAQLTRDYDVNKAQYTELLERLQKARLGEEADNTGSIRFEIVQPVTAELRPVAPKRLLLMLATLAGAFAVGGAIAFLLHRLKPVFNSARDIAAATGLTVLGVISMAYPEQQLQQSRRDSRRFGLAAGALCVVFITFVVINRTGARTAILQWLKGVA